MKLTLDNLKWYGRTLDFKGIRYFDFSASGFEFCFTGKKVSCQIFSDPQNFDDNTKGVVGIFISELKNPNEYKGSSYWENFPEDLTKKVILTEKVNDVVLFESENEKTVIIRVIKISEVNFGKAGIKEVEIDGKQILPTSKENSALKVELIGDSITCGFGIEGIYLKDVFTTKQERADKAYGFLAMKKLKAEFQECCWSGIGIISKYIDASVNVPDTSVVMPSVWPYTDKSLSLRLGIEPEVWDEKKFSPDVVTINLGTNDTSYIRDVEARKIAFVSGMRQFLEAIHRRSPKAKIVICYGVMGQEVFSLLEKAANLFSGDFKNVPIKLVKFPVHDEKTDGVATDWHPNAKTHEKIATILANEIKNW